MKIYDSHIRELLYTSFISNPDFICDNSTKVLDEMDICMGISRVDIAIINGKLHGYEIKSEQDTLMRLPSQIESYNKVFDTMTIVTSQSHIEKVKELVPSWWGISYVYESNGKLILKNKRKVKDNKNVDPFSIAQLLWKNELIELLESKDIKKGLKSKTRSALCEIVADNVNPDFIKVFVRSKLKARTNWRAVELTQLYDDLN